MIGSNNDIANSREFEQACQKISDVMDLYQRQKSSLIQILHHAQEIYGYLPLELQEFISREMDLPLSEVSGVVSFYSFFSSVPRGDHTIRICLGTACYVRGGKRIVEHLKEHLGIEIDGTTADGKFTLEIARCIGSCGLAPAVMIDDVVYKQVTPNKLDKILAEF